MTEPAAAGRHPVFVYGTLRPGQVNWSQLAPTAVRVEAARLEGHRLYELEYPCAVGAAADDRTGPPPVVRGDLVWLAPAVYDEALAALDSYEDVRDDDPPRSLYVRRRRDAIVERTGEPVPCWVYLAGPPLADRLRPEHEITGGEWFGTPS